MGSRISVQDVTEEEKWEYNDLNEEKKKFKALNTMQMIAVGFFGIILLGGALLWLPVSNQMPIAFEDALFTAVSAVCVTGLVTIVPAAQFTVFGKCVLLILIQIGGLGVIACMISFFLLIRKKITIRERVRIQQAYGMDTMAGMVRFVIRILKGMFLAEGIGAVLCAFCFVPEYGVVRGIGYSVFHSISAFCNAGIDILGSSSLIEYASVPLLNVTTMLLIVTGGLGFTVWYDFLANTKKVIREKLPKQRLFTRLSLHSRIVLVMTAILLVLGSVLFFLLECHNPETLGSMPLGEKWTTAVFQSVTTRTAGFATVPQSSLTDASKLVACIWMFIGGSPAGTAGGVKTTTVAMLLLTCMAAVGGKKDTECFGRKIPEDNIRTGITIIMIAFTFLMTGVILLCVLEPGMEFIDLLFEAVSAIGTVGLTADLTPSLCFLSKVVLMIMMYIGRIGPVTIALVFGRKAKSSTQLRDLPEKRILVG